MFYLINRIRVNRGRSVKFMEFNLLLRERDGFKIKTKNSCFKLI